MSHVQERLAVFLTALALLLATLPGPASAATSVSGPVASTQTGSTSTSRLTPRALELLSAAIDEGRSTVVIIVATKTGRGDNVARTIGALGGEILSKDNNLGYVTAIVPTFNVKAASAAVDVEIVDLDETFTLEPPGLDDGALDPETFPPAPPGPGTPSQNAYMPTRDTGAPQFVAANPTYDGRGVVIGILDTGIDLLAPELQTAKELDGTPTRKIVEWVTFTHPLVDPDPTWVNMSAQVTAVGGTFAVGTSTYTAPADGTYRFGIFDERHPNLGGELNRDVNRDGNPAGSSGLFAILWDTATGNVWVDTDQDKSFADQAAMRDYNVNFDVGIFGTDDPATAIRETVPFVVQTDGKNKFVNIGIVSGAHGTHVAGIAAGKDFFGGAFDGAAPEAKIASVRVCLFVAGCTARALVDGMVYVAKQAGSDVINMSIGGLPFLNDGNNSRAILYNRLVEQSNVQMFISAGNSGPGMNTVGDPSVASLVMSVGSYIHRSTWHDNYGNDSVSDDGLHPFSSRGPAEHGGFKPNIVAPGAAVSTTPMWQAGQPVGGTYALPPGYGMFNGTSMASPQAVGGAALLVSGAKQAGVQYLPAQLRQAINSSARYITRYAAAEQGNGLLAVGAAWDLLKQKIDPVTIESSVAVRTLLSGGLATPNTGVGIHDREGVAPGTSYTRTYTFTRRSGGSKAITYNATWVGNDGTFSSAATVSLPHNTPVSFPVTISPATAGLHSALLNLDDPSTPGVDFQTMNAVMAANALTEVNNYGVTVSGSAERTDTNGTRHFFAVPSGTSMIRVTATVTSGRMRMLRQHPFGVSFDNTNTTPYCSAGAACQTGQPAGTVQRTFQPSSSLPAAGVWEVTMDASRSAPTPISTYTVTVEAFGVTIDPSSWTVNGASAPSSHAQSFTITNTKRSFTGNAAGTVLSSGYEEGAVTFTAGSPDHVRYINVVAGTRQLVVQTFQNPGPTSDLDVFVFRCSAGPTTCTTLVGQGIGATSNETIVVNPTPPATTLAPALYKVVVEEFSIPSGTTSYRYFDVLNRADAFYGNISVVDAPALRPAGSSWTVNATATLTNSAGTNPTADGTSLTGGAARFHRGAVIVVGAGTTLASAEARFIP
ncbi:MAG TPA: S8 family serine peptidase [Candidatus Limnocylindria bacterium]|nr:S8 family serine peptidase [Candidatus Limnocylindria bacterium]